MKKLFNLILLFVSACLIGCGGDGGGSDIVNTMELTLDKSSINATYSGTITSIRVTSNVSWSVSSSASWVTVDPSSGYDDGVVEVRIAENTTADLRSATITVTGGGKTKSVSVSQEAAPSTLNVSPDAIDFKAEGETKNATITCNGSWSASSTESWCKTNVSSGNGDATLTITVDANSSSNARTANVIIKSSNTEKKITVNQAAGEIIPSEGDNGLPATPAPKR